MCESVLLADGVFEPIIIKSNEVRFCYNNNVLIDNFKMDIIITKASVHEVIDEKGKVIAYEFRVE